MSCSLKVKIVSILSAKIEIENFKTFYIKNVQRDLQNMNNL